LQTRLHYLCYETASLLVVWNASMKYILMIRPITFGSLELHYISLGGSNHYFFT
jgi:hypothetical protein